MRDEEELRAALRTLERHAPDPEATLAAVRAADDATPGRGPWRRRTALTGWPRGWKLAFAPLAAAASVVAIVTGLTLVASMTGPVTGRHGGKPVGQPARPFPTTADGIPAFVMLDPAVLHSVQPHGPRVGGPRVPSLSRYYETLPIVATATGQSVAQARLPGYVTATAASSGAFFAAVVRGSRAWFYEVRLTAGGHGATTARLPIPADAAPIERLAVSPDGRRLAYSTYVRHGPRSDVQNLVVAATANGAEHRWGTQAGSPGGSIGPMTWLADGRTLAFNWYHPAEEVSPASWLRLLDTRAPGHDLLASRPVLPLVNQAGAFGDYTISPDGKAVLGIAACLPGCASGTPGTIGGHPVARGSLIQFSLGGGAPVVRYTEPRLPGTPGNVVGSRCGDPLWVGESAGKVLLPCFQHRPRTPEHYNLSALHVVLLDNGRVRQLPWLDHLVDVYFTAFPGITSYDWVPQLPLGP
jgi:hypothetical protein